MAKRKPRKRQALKLQPNKTPHKFKDPVSFETLNFSWRVHNGYIDYDHPEFGWSKVDILLFLKKIVQSLQAYEGLTWHEVRQRRYCHPWGLNEIPKDCYTRLAERQIDVEELFQIGLGNKPRIIGYKFGSIFYLMWYDHHHKFCPTKAR